MKEILFKTNPQKVIEYLIQKPGKEFLSKEIQIATKMSKAGANFALNDLAKANLVNSQQKGKTYLYTINDENPVVKQLKILRTIMNLMPLIKKLKQKSSKIILYGSSSRGEDTEDSDIDLFIVTNLIEDIEKIVQRNKHYKKVQPIIRKPLKYIEMEKTDPTFYLKKFTPGHKLTQKELDVANSDFEQAKISFTKNKNYKWSTIQCYYSMFSCC